LDVVVLDFSIPSDMFNHADVILCSSRSQFETQSDYCGWGVFGRTKNLTAIYGKWNIGKEGVSTPWTIYQGSVNDSQCRWRYTVLMVSREPRPQGGTVLRVDLQLNRPLPVSPCGVRNEQYLELNFSEDALKGGQFYFGILNQCRSRKQFDVFKSSPEASSCSYFAMRRDSTPPQ
jgi:hypothetical protein